MDHRQIGQELELFTFSEHSPGSCFWLPNGTIVYNRLQKWMKEEQLKRGYKEIKTPIIAKNDLWKISGHWDKYKENMFVFSTNDKNNEDEYALSAMNCPKSCIVFKCLHNMSNELPLRLSDYGCLHRNELSNTLTGLTRVRQFHQDDAHIFCNEEHLKDEMKGCLEFLDNIYSVFGLIYELNLSTRPNNSMGGDALWDHAEETLKEILKDYTYDIDEKGGAFYGPKIDIKLTDSLGRKQQCGTIQLDFNLPSAFDLKCPIMIHRAIYGSFERFIAILLEHYQGKLPLWLSPRQVLLVPLSKQQMDYTLKVKEGLNNVIKNITCDIDNSGKMLAKKILKGQLKYYNYIVVIGKNEENDGAVNVRKRDHTASDYMILPNFISMIKTEIKNKH